MKICLLNNWKIHFRIEHTNIKMNLDQEEETTKDIKFYERMIIFLPTNK